jgi:hypothetical protein
MIVVKRHDQLERLLSTEWFTPSWYTPRRDHAHRIRGMITLLDVR